jgi:hypothetical protein
MYEVHDELGTFRFSSPNPTCCMFYIMSQIQHPCDKLFTVTSPRGTKTKYRFRVDTAILSPDGKGTTFLHTGEEISHP